MENELVRRISDIVQIDSKKEIELGKKTFCDKMNSFFSVSDVSSIAADASTFFNALETSTTMRAVIPPEILEGLKKGVYKFNKSDGQYLAQIVNSKGGGIVKNLRLEEVQKLSNPAGMNALSLQMATQMKLAEIQGLIEDLSVQVNRKLDSIIQNQVDTIIAKAESSLKKFENYKCHSELNIELKDVIFAIDDTIPLLKKDIQNRLNSINEIENRKGNWWSKTVKSKDIEDAAKNVSYIQEETQYLQVLFMVKSYLTKDINDIKDYTKYLNNIFTEDCYFMLNTWEYRPKKKNFIKQINFWVEKFPEYLTQINGKTEELKALEERDYGQNKM